MSPTTTAGGVVADVRNAGFTLDRHLVALDVAMWRRRCAHDGGTVAHHVLAVLHASERSCSALRGAPHRHGETPVRLRPALVLRRWRRAHRCVVEHLREQRGSTGPDAVDAVIADYVAAVDHCLRLVTALASH